MVLWQPGVEPTDVAGLASTRTFPLRSSFRPSYNMSINLVERMGAADSRKLLERSFAQFQADRSVVGLVRGIERNEEALKGLQEKLGGADGEYFEYASLRERLGARERALERKGREDRRGDAVESSVHSPAATSSQFPSVVIPEWLWSSSRTTIRRTHDRSF
ncbi:hypothetical protein GCM10020255_082560 [Rhodococcus baikonurensis]